MMKKCFYGLVVCLSMFAVVLCSGVASAAPGDDCNNDADCIDTVYCNGIESCSSETSLCVAGTNPCEAGEICNEDTETCDAAPGCTEDADCDDLLFCNGDETCVAGECVAGTNPCSGDTPECIEEGTGTCVECLIDDDCAAEEICNDDNVCIDDACPPDTPEKVLEYDEDGNCLLSKEELKKYSDTLKADQKAAKTKLKVEQKEEKDTFKIIKKEYAE